MNNGKNGMSDKKMVGKYEQAEPQNGFHFSSENAEVDFTQENIIF
jgi:hypothetical protein